MSTQLSPREWDALSAYLDNQLDPQERKRLEQQMKARADLRAGLEELRRTRHVLRNAPTLRVPRNFTLTPAMAGMRAERSRLYPAFKLAFALASVMFVLVLAGGLLTGAPGGEQQMAQAPAPEALLEEQADAQELPAATVEQGEVGEMPPDAEAPADQPQVEAPVPEEVAGAEQEAIQEDQAAEESDERVKSVPTEQTFILGGGGTEEPTTTPEPTPLPTETPTPVPPTPTLISPTAQEPLPPSPTAQPAVQPEQVQGTPIPWGLLQLVCGLGVLVTGAGLLYLRFRKRSRL